MRMSALDVMNTILDINETTDELQNWFNSGDIPNQQACKTVELLSSYRSLLIDIMEQSIIIGGKDGDKDIKEADN